MMRAPATNAWGAGEDDRIETMLDLAGLTYTASNHIAIAAAMDTGPLLLFGSKLLTRHDGNWSVTPSRERGRYRVPRALGANLPWSDARAVAHAGSKLATSAYG